LWRTGPARAGRPGRDDARIVGGIRQRAPMTGVLSVLFIVLVIRGLLSTWM
jgi:hypothetical protein